MNCQRRSKAGLADYGVGLLVVLLLAWLPYVLSWGAVGHEVVGAIAKKRLTEDAVSGLSQLLPAGQTISDNKVANWADHVRHYLPWSACLHYVDTPDQQCGYTYKRDCHNTEGQEDHCISGALNNFTDQLQSFGALNHARLGATFLRGQGRHIPQYLLVEAIKFVVHFVGDIHQPLHVGFLTDRGGNTITVHFFGRKHNLHEVWDTELIRHALEQKYGGSQEAFTSDLLARLQTTWSEDATEWSCSKDQPTCSDTFAQESIADACKYAYADAADGAVLGEEYFETRFPVVQRRLAQAGVRLGVELDRLFQRRELHLF